MKKLLSLLILFVMLFSTFPASAEETESLTGFERDAQILTALGFMESIDTTDLNAVVTRGEFAAVVIELLGIDARADGKRWFIDVDEKTANYDSISTAAQYGVIHGSDGYFYPDRQITYLEAATILVNALGYKDYAFYQGAYSPGYLKMAESTGIKKNVTAGSDTPVTVGMTARLLLNAGNANIVIPTIAGTKVTVEEGDTLFWEKHKISNGDGILIGNEYTTLTNPDGLSKNTIQIGNFLGNVYYNNEAINLIGQHVEYYYMSDDGENMVCWISSLEHKNEVRVVPSYDIEGFDKASMTLTYEYENRTKSTVIPASASVIYNGKMTIGYFYTENGVEKSIFDMENGEATLIDNDNDGDIDVVVILSYENYVVAGVNKIEKKIYDMYDASKVIDFEGYDEPGKSWIITDKNGKVVDFEKITEKTVISVAQSSDSNFLRGVVCEDTVMGVISGSQIKDGEQIIVMGNNEYVVCSNYTDNKSVPSVGTNVTIYFDFMGKIAGIGTETASTGFAFLMKIWVDDIEEEAWVKMITADGTKANYRLADKVNIDGVRFKGAGLIEHMKAMSDYQVIRYKMNNEKQIIMLDTTAVEAASDDNKLRCIQNMTGLRYYDQGSLFGHEGTMAVDASTIYFETPSLENKTRYDDYKIGSVVGFSTLYYVAGYTSDDDGFVCEVVHKSTAASGNFTGNDPWLLVADIVETIDEEDQPVKRITGHSNGKTIEIDISANCTVGPDGTTATVNDLDVGECIMYTKDANGKIAYFEFMTDLTKDGTIGSYNNGGTYGSFLSDSAFYCGWGYLAARKGEMLGLVDTKAKLSATPFKTDVVWRVKNTTHVYYVSDDKKTRVTYVGAGNTAWIMDYKNQHQTTVVVGIGGNININSLIIYEEERSRE